MGLREKINRRLKKTKIRQSGKIFQPEKSKSYKRLKKEQPK